MSLSDLLAPSDIFEARDLEHDLEQVLDDECYPAEETGQVQSVAGSEEPHEDPSPTFSSEEPTSHPYFSSTTPHASINRAESQSRSLLCSLYCNRLRRLLLCSHQRLPFHLALDHASFPPASCLHHQSQPIVVSSITRA
jgi:hypothetical protein